MRIKRTAADQRLGADIVDGYFGKRRAFQQAESALTNARFVLTTRRSFLRSMALRLSVMVGVVYHSLICSGNSIQKCFCPVSSLHCCSGVNDLLLIIHMERRKNMPDTSSAAQQLKQWRTPCCRAAAERPVPSGREKHAGNSRQTARQPTLTEKMIAAKLLACAQPRALPRARR